MKLGEELAQILSKDKKLGVGKYNLIRRRDQTHPIDLSIIG
jgi:hypothetical protein